MRQVFASPTELLGEKLKVQTNVNGFKGWYWFYNTIIVGNVTVLQQAPTTGSLHETEEG